MHHYKSYENRLVQSLGWIEFSPQICSNSFGTGLSPHPDKNNEMHTERPQNGQYVSKWKYRNNIYDLLWVDCFRERHRASVKIFDTKGFRTSNHSLLIIITEAE